MEITKTATIPTRKLFDPWYSHTNTLFFLGIETSRPKIFSWTWTWKLPLDRLILYIPESLSRYQFQTHSQTPIKKSGKNVVRLLTINWPSTFFQINYLDVLYLKEINKIELKYSNHNLFFQKSYTHNFYSMYLW